jgi:hypothetical protein
LAAKLKNKKLNVKGERQVKKVLLLTLCVLIALPSMAMAAGTLKACGQAFVFGIFGAPPPAVICWTECNGAPIGTNFIGDTQGKCVPTDSCGNFCFNLVCYKDVVRLGTLISGSATYFNGMFAVCGSTTTDVKCGPGQDTSISGLVVNMF